ncbi:MAG: hypothetical protein AABN95_00300 [Acidobacteriota bacterium]
MDNRPLIDIEETFGDFVEEFGGIVSDRLPRKPDQPRNADFIFNEGKVIAELKQLKEDPFKNKDFRKSFEKKNREWLDKGYITSVELQKVTSIKQLPDKCYDDILKLYMRPVKYAIEEANKQIKATKASLGVADYKGLVMIASDGNYFLEPYSIRFFVGRLLNNPNKYRSINTGLYFTANIVTVRPDDPSFSRLWVRLYRDKDYFENVSLDFLNRLYNGWFKHYQQVTGITLDNINETNEEGITEIDMLEQTRFVKPPKL